MNIVKYIKIEIFNKRKQIRIQSSSSIPSILWTALQCVHLSWENPVLEQQVIKPQYNYLGFLLQMQTPSTNNRDSVGLRCRSGISILTVTPGGSEAGCLSLTLSETPQKTKQRDSPYLPCHQHSNSSRIETLKMLQSSYVLTMNQVLLKECQNYYLKKPFYQKMFQFLQC